MFSPRRIRGVARADPVSFAASSTFRAAETAMRTALLLCLLVSTSALAHEPVTEASAGHERTPAAAIPVQRNGSGAVYGAALAENPRAPVSIEDASSNPSAHTGRPGAYSGRITEVCQKKGCWLVLAGEHGELARVFMHDHAFSVPKDATGEAIVYGTLSQKQLSAEEVAHLAEDGAGVPAERELQIDATSVLIRGG
jgi:hypothetical protein